MTAAGVNFLALRRVLPPAGLALLYFVLAVVGLNWATVGGAASPVWPAAGVAIAGLVLQGPRWWLAMTAASLAAFLAAGTDHALWVDFVLALGNGLAAAGAAAVLRQAGLRPALSRARDILMLAAAAFGAAAVAATVGAVVLGLVVGSGPAQAATIWLNWFLGDLGGVLIAAPLVLTWSRAGAFGGRVEGWHFATLLAATAGAAALVFLGNASFRTWHIFPVLIWAALAFRVRGAAVAMAIAAAVAIAGVSLGVGPFWELPAGAGSPVLLVQQFVAIASVTTLMLAAVVEERHGAERLAEARKRLAAVVETAMDAIVTVDARQRIVLFNPAAERMFGVSAAEVLGQPLDRFVPHAHRDSHREHLARFQQTGGTARRMGALGALRGLRANGEEFPMEASISLVESGGERLATVILRDVSEREAAEDARILLAREVDHRAKNALAVAQAIVGLTKAETKEKFVEAVRGRIAALARAHGLLSQSRWDGADLGKLVADEVRAYSGEGKFVFDGPPVMLAASAVQPVGLVVHELATNACKHGALCRAGGIVYVSWHVDPDGLHVEWRERGGPPAHPPKERGFGSRLLRDVVGRQLSGRLDLEWGEPGLTVRLDLPLQTVRASGASAGTKQEEAAAPAAAQTSGRRGRVLVVEDELLVGLELAGALEAAGWEVVGPAPTLAEGLKLADHGLDAAVLDINLKGEKSYPLARALKDKGVPVVFCTGYDAPDRDSGLSDVPVIRKPVSPRELTEVLASAA